LLQAVHAGTEFTWAAEPDVMSLDPPVAAVLAALAKIFTIFEGTSEIQRVIIGRAVTGLDVR
jgi:alkylation response protein AidB-like acyl-CoA dehydrogenase